MVSVQGIKRNRDTRLGGGRTMGGQHDLVVCRHLLDQSQIRVRTLESLIVADTRQANVMCARIF